MESRLPEHAYEARIAAVREKLATTDADAAGWFSATSIGYLTGFHHIQTERPVCLVVTPETTGIVVPRLERERVTPNERIQAVRTYFDYPGGEPIVTIATLLEELGVNRLCADAEGPPGTMGYAGPSLTESLTVTSQSWVDRMRWAKSDAELDLIRESARWGDRAHQYLADGIEPGAHPVTVSQRASLQGSQAMLDTLGDQYVPRTRGTGPVHAGFISGRQTRLPHGHTANRRLERGDVLVTGATANVDGYRSELERTMFLGAASDDHRDYFELMHEAQTIAIEALEPGGTLAAVDQAVWEYFDEQGITDLARHHVGHNIGIGSHEPPYIDRGWTKHCERRDSRDTADRTIEPGHVYTIEPGIYTDTAGYRHSDTVAVTDAGTERLTTFPRDLTANIIDIESKGKA
jgi:Xaa-Pro aminopeptidase